MAYSEYHRFEMHSMWKRKFFVYCKTAKLMVEDLHFHWSGTLYFVTSKAQHTNVVMANQICLMLMDLTANKCSIFHRFSYFAKQRFMQLQCTNPSICCVLQKWFGIVISRMAFILYGVVYTLHRHRCSKENDWKISFIYFLVISEMEECINMEPCNPMEPKNIKDSIK